MALPVSAATYFVKSGGTGNGASWSSPWNLNAIGWSSLKGGDTVCVAGGSYSGGLTTGKSGAAGSPITVKRAVASDATCGASTSGWNSAYDAQVVMGGTIGLQNSYVTIDGMVPNGITVTMQNPTGSDYTGIGVGGPTTGVVLRYIEVAGPCLSNFASCSQNGDHRSINLNSWNGSGYDLQDSFLFQYLNLHGSCTILWSAHSTNGIIEHSRFADSSTSNTAACHPNVIATQDSTNMTFRYNEVTNWQVEGIMTCPNGGCTSSWAIYGNLWHDPMAGSYPRILEAQGNQNGPYLFYNNTIVNNYYECAGTANGGSFASGSVSQNNIFWNSTAPCGLPSQDYDYSDAALSEPHGQGKAANPFVNLAGKNFHLAFDTNPGLALLSIFALDYDGNPRSTWSRGAYEFATTGGTGPAVPTGMSATVQ